MSINKINTIKQHLNLYKANPTCALFIKLEKKINKLARAAIQCNDHATLNELCKIRAQLVRNQAKRQESYLELNLTQDLPPTPLCPAYDKLQVPTVTSYQIAGANTATIKLDPKALDLVPNEIKHLSSPHTDLLFTMINGKAFREMDVRPGLLNFAAHRWVHRNALVHDEKSQRVEMGLFPIWGMTGADGDSEAIPFGSLKAIEVHTHEVDGDMRYSPDNAHFRFVEGSPFCIFWSVAKVDGRTCMTKTILIIDGDHPLSQALEKSISHCPHLAAHLEKLANVETALDKFFNPWIKEKKVLNEFDRLPLAFRKEIDKQIWMLHGSLRGIHGDFGSASRRRDPSLAAQYHSTDAQIIEATQRLLDELKKQLVTSQRELLENCQPLSKGDNVIDLMKYASACTEKKGGEQLPKELSAQQIDAIYGAFWELSGCPRINRFGDDHFPKASPIEKQKAILLAASRQPHIYRVEEKKPLTTEEIVEKILALAGDEKFCKFPPEKRAEVINKLLSNMDENRCKTIHGMIYQHSTDPKKGGDEWGKRHIADDIALLNEVVLTAFYN